MADVGVSLDWLNSLLPKAEKGVSFREFVTSPDYCGETQMYEYWLEQGDALDDNISELILDGSIGGGKTTFSTFYLVYRLYKLFLKGSGLRKYLGVAENSPIYVLYFSVSLKQAQRSGFQQLINVIDQCKWFTDNYPRDKRLESEVRFPNDFNIVFASGELHQISLNVVAFILDEANFRKGVGLGMRDEYSGVTNLYSQLIDRQITRFASENGNKSLAILVSSASYQSSFVEERKNLIAGNKNTAIITSVGYKIKSWMYSKEMFEVFIGTDTINPQIIETEEQKNVLLRATSSYNLSGLQDKLFVKVPENLRQQFQTNINLSLQNHCGIPTQVQGKLITNFQLIRDSYYEDDAHRWFSTTQATLSNGDNIGLMDYVNVDRIENPHVPHFFFLDLSIRHDSAGFSCVRVDGENEQHKKILTHVFTIEVIPPPFPHETQISKFEDFMLQIAKLVNVCGFATDQFQSTNLRQNLCQTLGLEDKRISIDSSDEFYLLWLNILVEKRMKMLYHPTLHKEMQEAIHDVKKRRVVKANGSSDDCLQSFVGATFLAETSNFGSIGSLHDLMGGSKIRRIVSGLGYK